MERFSHLLSNNTPLDAYLRNELFSAADPSAPKLVAGWFPANARIAPERRCNGQHSASSNTNLRKS
jgi:hypothetical protein